MAQELGVAGVGEVEQENIQFTYIR